MTRMSDDAMKEAFEQVLGAVMRAMVDGCVALAGADVGRSLRSRYRSW